MPLVSSGRFAKAEIPTNQIRRSSKSRSNSPSTPVTRQCGKSPTRLASSCLLRRSRTSKTPGNSSSHMPIRATTSHRRLLLRMSHLARRHRARVLAHPLSRCHQRRRNHPRCPRPSFRSPCSHLPRYLPNYRLNLHLRLRSHPLPLQITRLGHPQLVLLLHQRLARYQRLCRQPNPS